MSRNSLGCAVLLFRVFSLLCLRPAFNYLDLIFILIWVFAFATTPAGIFVIGSTRCFSLFRCSFSLDCCLMRLPVSISPKGKSRAELVPCPTEIRLSRFHVQIRQWRCHVISATSTRCLKAAGFIR